MPFKYFIYSQKTEILIGTIKAENDERALRFSRYKYGEKIIVKGASDNVIG